MMEVIGVIITIAGLIAGSSFGQAKIAGYANRVKQGRALARLKAEPLYRVGALIEDIYFPTLNGIDVLFSDCVIVSIDLGRVVIQAVKEPALLVPFTCVEFEKMIIIVRKPVEVDELELVFNMKRFRETNKYSLNPGTPVERNINV